MTRDIINSSLEERAREYLTRFPHSDTDMSKYGVCRDWLISVIQAEAERCAEIAADTEYEDLRGINMSGDVVAVRIRSAYGLDGKKE